MKKYMIKVTTENQTVQSNVEKKQNDLTILYEDHKFNIIWENSIIIDNKKTHVSNGAEGRDEKTPRT